jgi:hypothetical protein
MAATPFEDSGRATEWARGFDPFSESVNSLG